MKYLLYFILVISLSAFTFADGDDNPITGALPDPESLLDSPVPITEAPPAESTTVFGITIHKEVFNLANSSSYNIFSMGLTNLNVLGILNILENLRTSSSTLGSGGHFYADFNGYGLNQSQVNNINGFQNNVSSFLSDFSQGAELLTMQLGQGDSSFLSTSGDTFSVGTENFYNADQTFNTTNLTLYVGRKTTINTPLNGNNGVPSAATNLMTVTIENNQYEISAFHSTSPIVLDMNDDQKLEASNGQWLPHQIQANVKFAEFDLNGDGFNEIVEWVGANDGILVRYDGGTMNGFNMFGTPGGFEHGYEKLSAFDGNKDQKLTGAELNGLSIWQDKNGNAKVDSGEVRSLEELGITELGTQHKYMMSYFVQNGKKKLMWDWFPVMQMAKKVRK